ncbi:MAG: 30S ribosomal protein S20 [Ruminococcaceae bacterium]|nr:30S ribosomal protein S20 [Oscillospiraceae bacterium]
MPNIKSAKKRVLITETKTLQNKMFKTALKTAMKKYEAAVASGDKEAATKAYALVVKKLDVAAAKGVVHKNNVARKKSQYTLMLNGMGV